MKTTGTPWPHVLADLRAKQQALGDLITIVATHFVDDASPGERPASPAPSKKRAMPGPQPRPASGNHRAAILAALAAGGGSMAPCDLAKATGTRVVNTLMYRLQPLVRAKSVFVTGRSNDRRVSLPGRGPKEDL